MSFLDGKPRTATDEDCKAKWGGSKSGERFRCALCGHRFQVGDVWRCLYTNGLTDTFEYAGKQYSKYSGNPFVCSTCDGPNVMEHWKARCDEMYSDRNWYFVQSWFLD